MFIFRHKDPNVKKCVSVAMARKNSDGGGNRHRPKASPKPSSPRHSPSRGARPPADSPSGAGHYAGCKWTEPPLPSALPPPPQHWMQTPHALVLPYRQLPAEHDIENQLKVLLKVQA